MSYLTWSAIINSDAEDDVAPGAKDDAASSDSLLPAGEGLVCFQNVAPGQPLTLDSIRAVQAELDALCPAQRRAVSLEVGALGGPRLRDLAARLAPSPLPAASGLSSRMWGLPVHVNHNLGALAWRTLDAAGEVLEQGILPSLPLRPDDPEVRDFLRNFTAQSAPTPRLLDVPRDPLS